MRIAIGNDQHGIKYKNLLVKYLEGLGHRVINVGSNVDAPSNYPEFAFKAAELVANGEADRGIVICGSGEGIMIAANKIKGIRCGLAYNDEVASLMRRHNDANMISFSGDFMDYEDVQRRVDIFLATDFEGGRHQVRVDMIKKIEEK